LRRRPPETEPTDRRSPTAPSSASSTPLSSRDICGISAGHDGHASGVSSPSSRSDADGVRAGGVGKAGWAGVGRASAAAASCAPAALSVESTDAPHTLVPSPPLRLLAVMLAPGESG
jgi:hypothetical protein